MQVPGRKPISLVVDVLEPEERVALGSATRIHRHLRAKHLEVETSTVQLATVVDLEGEGSPATHGDHDARRVIRHHESGTNAGRFEGDGVTDERGDRV